MANGSAKKSKYDEVIKLPMSFEQAMGVLVKTKPATPKKTKKRR